MYISVPDKRPRRNPAPATKLVDANNTEQAGLPFQQKSIHDYRAAREAHDAPTGTSPRDSENPDVASRAALTTTDRISSPEPFGHIPAKRPISAISDDSGTTSDTGAKSTDHPQKRKGSWFI